VAENQATQELVPEFPDPRQPDPLSPNLNSGSPEERMKRLIQEQQAATTFPPNVTNARLYTYWCRPGAENPLTPKDNVNAQELKPWDGIVRGTPIEEYLKKARGGLDPVLADSFHYQAAMSLQDATVQEVGGVPFKLLVGGLLGKVVGPIAKKLEGSGVVNEHAINVLPVPPEPVPMRVEPVTPRNTGVVILKNEGAKGGMEGGPTIQFGANSNQTSHTFRHVANGGYDVTAVQNAVAGDIKNIGMSLPQGQYTGTVVVNGTTFNYSAYRLPDGTIKDGVQNPVQPPMA